MTKAHLIAAVALGVLAAPQAQAQLLGGGAAPGRPIRVPRDP